MHVALDFIGRNSAYSVTLIRRDTQLLLPTEIITMLPVQRWMRGYSRLWGSSDAEAHQSAEEEDPAINRCKSTHQAIEHSPQHAHLQTLCVEG